MNIEIDKSSRRLVTLSNDILFTIINVLRKGCKKVENHFKGIKKVYSKSINILEIIGVLILVIICLFLLL